ncbi:hypothetical protein GCM10025734_82870 [Kitasatospora paranensis]
MAVLGLATTLTWCPVEATVQPSVPVARAPRGRASNVSPKTVPVPVPVLDRASVHGIASRPDITLGMCGFLTAYDPIRRVGPDH